MDGPSRVPSAPFLIMKNSCRLAIALSVGALIHTAQDATLHAADVPQKIDISSLPGQAQLVDEVIVPVPSEIFGVLDKLGKPVWADVLRPAKKQVKTPKEAAHIGLLLGTLIGEGFIAVEAEDAEEVKKIGKHVLTLSKALGVEKWVKERSNSILDAAEARDWAAVRTELSGAMDKVKEGMMELNSEDVAQLVSLGGWLRGTEALTAVVKESYSADGAELLHQPILLEFFERRVDGMRPKLKTFALVEEVRAGLTEIKPLIALQGGSEISEKTVREVHAVAARLVKAIYANVN